jgi:hemerythrin-like domain-containing protein
MALLHNSIFRGYNSIYNQAPHVQSADKSDFIGYALTWHKFVASHHDDEEANLFTKVEEVLDDKNIWSETLKEHGMFGFDMTTTNWTISSSTNTCNLQRPSSADSANSKST